MSEDQFAGQAELADESTDLVLEQLRSGSTGLSIMCVGSPAAW
jgi:hypothetical protein